MNQIGPFANTLIRLYIKIVPHIRLYSLHKMLLIIYGVACTYLYIYTYVYIFKDATPHSAGPGQGSWGPGKVPCGVMLGSFEVQVEDLGGLSSKFGSLFGFYVRSCREQMGVWEVQRLTVKGFGRA